MEKKQYVGEERFFQRKDIINNVKGIQYGKHSGGIIVLNFSQ